MTVDNKGWAPVSFRSPLSPTTTSIISTHFSQLSSWLAMNKDNPSSQHGHSSASSTCHKGQLPSKEDLTSIFSSSGPIKDAKSAKTYLISKAWLLQEERLSFSKVSHILLTTLLVKGIPSEVTTVIKAVAFAIEDTAA